MHEAALGELCLTELLSSMNWLYAFMRAELNGDGYDNSILMACCTMHR